MEHQNRPAREPRSIRYLENERRSMVDEERETRRTIYTYIYAGGNRGEEMTKKDVGVTPLHHQPLLCISILLL